MTWTDEEFGTLLAETFRDHELDEDGEDARRIAHRCVIHPRRRRWPAVVAAAAAIVVAGGLATYGLPRGGSGVSHRPSPGGTVAGVPSSAPGVQSPQPHLAPARAEAERLLDWVDLPGARAVAAAPASALATQGTWAGAPIGRDITTVHQTRFWVVPGATVAQLTGRLKTATPPAGYVQSSTGRDSSTEPHITVDSIFWDAGQTANYVARVLDVQLFQDGSNVDVRADGQLALRPQRPATSFISGTVSSVTVRYQPATTGQPRTSSATVTNRAQIADLTRLVNGLVELTSGARGCPGIPVNTTPPKPAVATMVFHSDTGVSTFTETVSCVPMVEETKEGKVVSVLSNVVGKPRGATMMNDGGFATAAEYAVTGP